VLHILRPPAKYRQELNIINIISEENYQKKRKHNEDRWNTKESRKRTVESKIPINPEEELETNCAKKI
jgi:hypothetical protein